VKPAELACRFCGVYYRNTVETLTFRVSEDEARAIRAKARQARLTVSEYLRRRALNRRQESGKPRLIRCAKTGATIFGAGTGEAPLTTESVREYLAEFP
jgi:hypothetical protein